MPNILTTFRNTKRYWNYLKLYSHCPENVADSADVFTFSNIDSYPKIFPFKPRRFFYSRFRKLYIVDIEYPFSIDKARKLGCIEHRVVTCHFSKSIDNALKFGGKIYFLDFTLFILNSEFIVFPHDLIGGSKQCSLNAQCSTVCVSIILCAINSHSVSKCIYSMCNQVTINSGCNIKKLINPWKWKDRLKETDGIMSVASHGFLFF